MKIPDYLRDQEEEVFTAPTSTIDVMSAQFEQGIDTTTVSAYSRKKAMESLGDQGRMITPEGAKELFDIDVKEPVSEGQAFYLQDLKKDEERRAAIINNGPRSALTSVGGFFANMGGAMSDPVDFALGWAIGGGIGHVAKAAKVAKFTGLSMKASGLSKVASKVTLSRGAQLGVDMAGNALSQAINEVANMQASEAEQKEYTANQALTNIMVGSVGFTMAMHGLSAGLGKILKVGPSHTGPIYSMAEMLAENGVDPSEAVRITLKYADQKLDITPEFRTKADELFPDVVDDIFKDAEDIIDIKEGIDAKIKSGDLDPAMASKYVEELQSLIPEEKLQFLGDDPQLKLTPEEIEKISQVARDEKYRMEYEAASERLMKDLDEAIDEDTMQNIVVENVDEEYNNLKQQIDEDDNVLPYKRDMVEQTEKAIEEAKTEEDFAKEISKCFGA